jgi:hypothetical protein
LRKNSEVTPGEAALRNAPAAFTPASAPFRLSCRQAVRPGPRRRSGRCRRAFGGARGGRDRGFADSRWSKEDSNSPSAHARTDRDGRERLVHIAETAPWLAEYLLELTVFPNGKHDDQADSTAQFLDWYKMPFPGQNIFELYRMQAEQLRRRTSSWVRLRAPPGIGSVQTFSGRHINVGLDGAIEMSAGDAQYYIRDGWTKLAEWTTEDAV